MTLDKDGYPTEETLKQIKEFDVLKISNVEKFLELIEDNWWFAESSFQLKKTKKRFKLVMHTFGWSGNEDVIKAMQENPFWWIYWESSTRGGHYTFEGPLK